MQTIYRLSRYFLPVVFFGYAPFANLAFFEDPGSKLAAFDMGALRGTVTASFDTAYKTAMPHRSASIGLIGAARYVLAGEGRAGVIAGKDGWLFTAEEARAPLKDINDSLTEIATISSQLADAGVKLVLVPVPAKIDIESAQADAPELSVYLAELYSDFLNGLRRNNVDVVDTRPALLALGREAFFATDTHWTIKGAKAVATTVAASHLIDVGNIAMNITASPTKTLTGDLVSYVTSASLAPRVGLAVERVTPYLANPANAGNLDDLFGQTAIDIVLVGTSYSANPDWSFAEALKLALKSDVLNAAAQGLGPVKPMVDYLASDAFRDATPKVVIWEFPLRYLTDPDLWSTHDHPMELASAN